MKHARLLLAIVLGLFGDIGYGDAGLIALHQGSTTPSSEGFSSVFAGATTTTGPLASDLGFPAWSVTGTAQSSQFVYLSPAPTASQLSDIAAQGFTLTLVARVMQNGLAPAYDSTNHVVIASATANYLGRRWEIDLGLNGSGDTVVVLPTSLDNAGPGSSIRAPGPSFTLTGSGSTYHTYQLLYDASTNQADLFVDGIERISNYAGHTSFVGTSALQWGAFSGGQGNFNLVRLDSGSSLTGVPEPSTLALTAVALLGLSLYAWKRRPWQPVEQSA